MSRSHAYSVFIFTAVIMAVFFLLPIAVTVREAFVGPDHRFTFEFLAGVWDNPVYREGLWNSLRMAVFSTLASLLVALPLAVLSSRCHFPGKAILASAILVPLILPPFVGAIGMQQILSQEGALNAFLGKFGLVSRANPPDWLGEGKFPGVVLMNALHLYPIFFLNITAALANLDPAMEESAANLGCPPLRRFFRITLPLAMPGIFAGGIIVFIWSFTELGVPLMFQYNRVTSVQIWDGIKDMGGNPMPYALVVVTLIFSVLLFLVSKRVLGKHEFSTSGRAATASQLRTLEKWPGIAATAAFSAVTFIALLPHLGVLLTSVAGDWYGTVFPVGLTTRHIQDALGHSITLPSIQNSLLYASFATLFDLVLGVAVAFIVTRTRIPGRHLLDSLAMLPLAVPGLVLAFGYLAVTREGQPLSFLMLGKHDSPVLLLIIAYSMRRLPYIVRSAAAGFQQTSVSLEEAAQNLGATPLRSLTKITLPLIAANLVAGALLAFAFAMLEVSDSLILAQRPEDYPIMKAIYILAGNLGNGEALASALGSWAMIFLGITLAGASLLLGKKLGALFRV
ncbi:MAG: iron ABC transporter permease [Verrucomicrobiales bacterium]|nr:iron ABC transporter permease [Verrucomicrobiales bacterium]